MSDPQESLKVEHVLENIRRLVAVDQQRGQSRAGGSRLVLTSDLRVEEGGDDPGSTAMADASGQSETSRPAASASATIAATAASTDHAGSTTGRATSRQESSPGRSIPMPHSRDAEADTSDETDADPSHRDSADRVQATVDGPELDEDEAELSSGVDLVTEPYRGMSLERRIAELENAIARDGGEWEPDGSEEQTQHRPDHVPQNSAATGAGDDEAPEDETLAAIEAVVSEADDPPSGAPAIASDIEKHVEADAPQVDLARSGGDRSEMGGDVTRTADQHDDPDDMHREQADVEAIGTHGAENAGETAEPSDESDVDGISESADGMAAKASVPDEIDYARADALRFAHRHGAPRPSWADPETPPQEEQAAEAVSDGDLLDAEYAARTQNRPEADAARADEDEALIDEEALRELIAEIVREELSGALGERITRNVKKLVRREIMRAMAARDFE